MTVKLLLVDPQVDFCDLPGAALPVPGADADLRRVAALLDATGGAIDDVIVTLDSHPGIAIERTSFWEDGAGRPVAPFTTVTAVDVRAGRFRPRAGVASADEVLAYLDALEAGGRYRLTVWPVHCVIGTRGHALHDAIADAVARWELARARNAARILKGRHPLTEQYSAVRAEVPRADDASTDTNRELVERARPGEGWLYVAGEAASHCVAATVSDLYAEFEPAERARVVLLSDGTSPVAGAEALAEAFYARAQAQGMRRASCAQAAAWLAAGAPP